MSSGDIQRSAGGASQDFATQSKSNPPQVAKRARVATSVGPSPAVPASTAHSHSAPLQSSWPMPPPSSETSSSHAQAKASDQGVAVVQPAPRTVKYGTVTLTEAARPVAAPAQSRGRSPPCVREPKPRGTVARVLPNVPRDFIRDSSPVKAAAEKSDSAQTGQIVFGRRLSALEKQRGMKVMPGRRTT